VEIQECPLCIQKRLVVCSNIEVYIFKCELQILLPIYETNSKVKIKNVSIWTLESNESCNQIVSYNVSTVASNISSMMKKQLQVDSQCFIQINPTDPNVKNSSTVCISYSFSLIFSITSEFRSQSLSLDEAESYIEAGTGTRTTMRLQQTWISKMIENPIWPTGADVR